MGISYKKIYVYIMKNVLQISYYVEKVKDVDCEEESKNVSHSGFRTDHESVHQWRTQVGRRQFNLLTALLEYFIVQLEYLNLIQSQWQGTANIWESLGPARPTLGYTTE